MYKKSNHWHNRSDEYKAKKLRRQNNSKKKESLVARIVLWEAEGRPGKIPAIRTPVVDAIAIYRNHGITQEMYFEHWGRYIEEPENRFTETDSRSTGVHYKNTAKINKVRELLEQSPITKQTVLKINLPESDPDDDFKITL
jgi:hypothetical protein